MLQKRIQDEYISRLDDNLIKNKWKLYKDHFLNLAIQENIKKSKEEEYQEGFLRDLFVNILGYTLNPNKNFNLRIEFKNIKDSKKCDGAIIIDGKVLAVIELKGPSITDLKTVENQAFMYKNNQRDCHYVITSNYEKLRFYIDNVNDYKEFNLFKLTEEEFKELFLILCFDSIKKNLPKLLKSISLDKEEIITKELYKDYSKFKTELFENLIKLNLSINKLSLFKKSQKLLDRFLFIFFAEDTGLIEPNLIRKIIDDWEKLKELDSYIPLYDRIKKYFGYLNTGNKGKPHDIFAYNGGLFKVDEVLDSIKIDDEVLKSNILKLHAYNFKSEVDVNILGHIFENSLSAIEEIQAELEGKNIDKRDSKRKKDGVFYTPKYITKYIVENTVGKLCNKKKEELQINEDDYFLDSKRQKKDKITLSKKLDTYRKWLLSLTICDPACGSGAFLNEALSFLITEHGYIDELNAKIYGDSLVLPNIENSILENNIFGVDLNEEAVEIAKLSLWLRTAKPNRKLNDLSNNIKCGNSLIDNPEITQGKVFNWQKEFPQVFENGGFDIVIGNPPYVQLQKMKNFSEGIKNYGYKTFEKTGDLYCLFYELGNNILKQKGLLGFITSNKWLRAAYGKSLRDYLLEYTSPQILIDLGSGIFNGATVDSNILIFQKNKSKGNIVFSALDISKEKIFRDFSYYQNQVITITPKKNEIWVITNKIAQDIKQKIEQQGTQLKDWDINIYRGVLTGLNEAFIIDRVTKDKLIAEDAKSAKIIKPILRGRDIKRYSYNFADLWLIFTHNGYKETPRVDINDYPAIKKHLDAFEPKLSKREDKGNTPHNLRNCAYIKEFEKEKIIYQEISRNPTFYLDNKMFYPEASSFLITGSSLKLLLLQLNSKLISFNYRYNYAGGGLGESGYRYKKLFLQELPIKKISVAEQQPFIKKAEEMLTLTNQLQELKAQFIRVLKRRTGLKLSTKLKEWNTLSFIDFINELNKNKLIIPLKDEANWEDFFNNEKLKVEELQKQIIQTDTEIDRMIYELYNLTPEEIEVVEGIK